MTGKRKNNIGLLRIPPVVLEKRSPLSEPTDPQRGDKKDLHSTETRNSWSVISAVRKGTIRETVKSKKRTQSAA